MRFQRIYFTKLPKNCAGRFGWIFCRPEWSEKNFLPRQASRKNDKLDGGEMVLAGWYLTVLVIQTYNTKYPP